jgi:hypothetical protein
VDSGQADITHTTRIENNTDRLMQFALEPWGEVFALEPGRAFDIVFDGPPDGTTYVEYREGGIALWAWEGSVARLFLDGQELSAHDRQRVPPGLAALKDILREAGP